VKPQRLLATNFKLPLTGVLIFIILLFLFVDVLWRDIDYTNYLHHYLITHLRLSIACLFVTRFASSDVVLKRQWCLTSAPSSFAGSLIETKVHSFYNPGLHRIAI
jgi:hypothetical protein